MKVKTYTVGYITNNGEKFIVKFHHDFNYCMEYLKDTVFPLHPRIKQILIDIKRMEIKEYLALNYDKMTLSEREMLSKY